MFSRILIANRGEIALRIIRACKELGIETVAVYSEADKDAIYLDFADRALCIGPGAAGKSYLDVSRIISAAEIASVDAIHPGYGFLAENAHFAEICQSHRIGFIGPTPQAIARMGDKASAKRLALEAGVPVTPGSKGIIKNEKQAVEVANRIGYPVIIKASAGGGGRGMRVAHNQASLINGLHQAKAEAKAAFKDDSVYVEQFVERPRHVEIQIIADTHDTTVHLGERDCTLQRRHQKLIEESPSPAITPELRERMGACAVALAKKAAYTTTGTVEFLVDPDGNFFFMEMNARIQVEHPVTEAVTGRDLIKLQITCAAGEPLGFSQDDVTLSGHALECRINAEDYEHDFKPSPGSITKLFLPGGIGVRFDTHVYSGYRIPSHYDSMIGKLIVHGCDREQAVTIALRALDELVVEGVNTTAGLHVELLRNADFLAGRVDTGFIERYLAAR